MALLVRSKRGMAAQPHPRHRATWSDAPHIPHLHTQASKLQQQYEQGRLTDVVIRVRVVAGGEEPPAAKRKRMSKAAAAADAYTDIKAHALVLCTLSPYFDKALSGDWAEAAERRVELEVEDEQELADLRLLINLSYSDSYSHDNGQLLPIDTRLRLATRADALEFVGAVDQIVASLPEGLDFEGAMACMGGLPPAVEAHLGIALARTRMAAALALGIGQLEGKTGDVAKQGLEAGVQALAKCLGPIVGMFEQGKALVGRTLPCVTS